MAPATSYGSLGEGLVCAGGGASSRRLGVFCLPLEVGPGGGCRGGVVAQTGSGAAQEAAERRTAATSRTVAEGGHGLRLSQRYADPEAHCLDDSQGVGRAVSSNHVWRVLRGLGWSCQIPERGAIQGDENAIAHWKRYK